jgi:GNAT superfamily N-acetyltransferase
MDMKIEFKTGPADMDFATVTEWLGGTYWSPGITRAEVEFGAAHSALVVGGFTPAGEQVSYLRVASDRVRFAYVMDVIVHPSYRSCGVGTQTLRYALSHPDLQLVYQWVLHTDNAQKVYARLGFKMIEGSEHWMILRHPRPDRSGFEEPLNSSSQS